LWRSPDEDLVALARRELVQLGLVRPEAIRDGCVIRQPKAYPVYDDAYQEHVATVPELARCLPNLHLVGRNGMHDTTTRSCDDDRDADGREHPGGYARYDVWRVNEDAEYLEENAERNPAGRGRAVAFPGGSRRRSRALSPRDLAEAAAGPPGIGGAEARRTGQPRAGGRCRGSWSSCALRAYVGIALGTGGSPVLSGSCRTPTTTCAWCSVPLADGAAGRMSASRG